MELLSQHDGSGNPLAVVRQPSLENRPRFDYEREPQRSGVLSLDQIKAIRSRNEYTEGPSATRKPTPPRTAPRTAPRPEKQERTHEIILVNVNNNYERRTPGHPAPGVSPPGARLPPLSRSASSGSNSSASSEQGLLLGRSPPARPGPAPRPGRTIRTQPKPAAQPEAALKPAGKEDLSQHRLVCEQCGRCKCAECTAPRALPSCLACGGQCLCSAETLLEHGTCMCLVKGLFYHCSNDDEGDSCADRPCSLSRSHCCSRFLCMGLMSAVFPCLLCYPPAKACVRACQRCHDRLNRPGCRCKNSNTVYCKLENWSPGSFQKPS
ncbi:protein sprouty homolog 1-like [Anguilla anguilla]|uniref:protein sprouty homolog 1-like n=1 Tax=Anguilla anguilla TaxID=7936 RepID=UPI0015B2D614|nr:protein sprouty homolog 1-like [Anguilla anguilla]XP_035272586.1 protein sprouty homolog 1-like [Anguilla anguilla]XP_035272587.1 protein sprouty homolog 1-like [Anguilla anguilla]